MNALKKKTVVGVCAIGAALLFGACGNAAQKEAYEKAVKMDQLPGDHATALVMEYERVVRMEPDSAWARKAQARIDAIKAQAKADELHKSVFQEHGVD